jgi:hypothetical protein
VPQKVIEMHFIYFYNIPGWSSFPSVHPVIRLVIRLLSIRPVVHTDRHPRSSEVADCTPSLCWVWHCSFLPTKNGKEINQEWNNNNLRWWCCCCRNVATGVQRGTSIGGMPQSSKTIVGGPINMAPLK